MKKFLQLLMMFGLIAGALLLTERSKATPVVGPDGLLYGNICRNGPYWQIIPYVPVNSTCWMRNMYFVGYGVVTAE